ncbi:DUF1080 domain-containing protein [uncultured Draconibacterium sp.]|uniref:3-keto-disaccharide hydrolase n=1 Tax=uncultured Draconibacterium sp. TaxID=1573823 RepID=UPI0025E4BCE8|nr:DUF1080 domain-containing protein [uncultured Draconibacterium sp.]
MVSKKGISILSLLSMLIVLFACNKPKEEEWIQLFNGKDLENWQIKFRCQELGVNYKNTFRVEDGLLKVRYDNWNTYDRDYGHIFYKDEFSHYKLRAEYRFVGEQVTDGPGWAFKNNGLMIHGQKPETMQFQQGFPVSLEVQLLGGNGKKERPTGNLCTPGTNVVYNDSLYTPHIIESSSDTYHDEQWVTIEVHVHGSDSIKHFVNGELVLQYEQPQIDTTDMYIDSLIPADGNLILSKGTISLQAESHPIDFRKVELLVLEKNEESIK